MTDQKAKSIALQAAMRMWSQDVKSDDSFSTSNRLLDEIEQALRETEQSHPTTIDRQPRFVIFTKPLKLTLLALVLAFLILVYLAL